MKGWSGRKRAIKGRRGRGDKEEMDGREEEVKREKRVGEEEKENKEKEGEGAKVKELSDLKRRG